MLVNTVREAQEVFAALDGISLTLDDLRLFHARFPAGRRDEIEKKLMDLYGKGPEDGPNPLRPYRSILVSTQTVEQSLDVDFDVMVTAVCPIDLLLQRSGRVQRHEGIHPRPLGTAATLHILLPKEGSLTFGPTGHVYDVDPLLRTLAILHARETIRLPDELRCLIEKCYGNEALPSDVIPDDALTDAAAKLKIKHEKAINEAKTHLIPDPADSHFVLARLPNQPVHEAEEGDRASYFHAQTRMTDEDSETVPVLLPDTPQLIQVACRDHAPDRETLRKLFLRKANIPAWWLKDASGEPPVFEGPRWLRGHRVIPLTKGRWQATVDGRSYTLFDDNMSGLSWVPDQESGANEKATEALQE